MLCSAQPSARFSSFTNYSCTGWSVKIKSVKTLGPVVRSDRRVGFYFLKTENYPVVALTCFYRAMHFSAKRGLAIACRLSVCL